MLYPIYNKEYRQGVLSNVLPPPPIDKTIQALSNYGRYNAFGNVLPINDNEIFYAYRSGTDHYVNGRIDAVKYNVTTRTWGSASTIIPAPSGLDWRDPRTAILGGEKIIMFASKWNGSTFTFTDLGYFLSTDISGTSWGDYVDITSMIPSGVNAWITYGQPVETDTPNTYYAVCYGQGTPNFKIWLWKIVYADGGVTLTRIDVYSGPVMVSETTLEKIGVNKYVMISRVNSRNLLCQFSSTDGGITWSGPYDTNLGSITATKNQMAYLLKFNGHLFCAFQDRETDYIKVARASVSDDIPNPIGWTVYNHVANHMLGYPSMCLIPGFKDRIMFSWTAEPTNGGSSPSTATIYAQEEDFNQYLPQ